VATRLQSANDRFHFCYASGEHLLLQNGYGELDNQNISGASERVPVTTVTVYNAWISFFSISLVLSLFSTLLFAPPWYPNFLFPFPKFSFHSFLDLFFFILYLFHTYSVAYLDLIFPGFSPSRPAFDPWAVNTDLEWRDFHWMRLSPSATSFHRQLSFYLCFTFVYKTLCSLDADSVVKLSTKSIAVFL
jgi:hypothetical protein